MLRVITFALGFLMATATFAADLGKLAVAPPATTVAMFPAVPDQWRGCYVEAGAAGRFIKSDDRAATGSGGLGCTFKADGNPVVGGIFARYSFSLDADTSAAVLTFDQPVTVAASAGYLIQPNTRLYILGGYSIGKGDDKGFIAGFGAETVVYKTLSLAAEFHTQFTDLSGKDEQIHSIGLYVRHRF